jgi:hypothetical protein
MGAKNVIISLLNPLPLGEEFGERENMDGNEI